jgi:hypothetical protein
MPRSSSRVEAGMDSIRRLVRHAAPVRVGSAAVLLLAAAAAFFLLPGCAGKPARLRILFTAEVSGYLTPCG